MFCDQCGSENRNDRKFCSNCGSQLRDYTKPRENLIMPDEIQNEQNAIKKRNSVAMFFNIAMCIVLIGAIICTIVSFKVEKNIQMPLSIVCIVLFSLFFILWISKAISAKAIMRKTNSKK